MDSVNTASAVEFPAVTSDTADGSYNLGDEINVIATFSEAVSLSGGNFVITLDLSLIHISEPTRPY